MWKRDWFRRDDASLGACQLHFEHSIRPNTDEPSLFVSRVLHRFTPVVLLTLINMLVFQMDPTELCQVSEAWVGSYIVLEGNALAASIDTISLFSDDTLPRLRSRKAFLGWLVDQGLVHFDDAKLDAFIAVYVGLECQQLLFTAIQGGYMGVDRTRVLRLHKRATGLFRAILAIPGFSEPQRQILLRGICSTGWLLWSTLVVRGRKEAWGWLATKWIGFRDRKRRRRAPRSRLRVRSPKTGALSDKRDVPSLGFWHIRLTFRG
jgi:hypothetical protein